MRWPMTLVVLLATAARGEPCDPPPRLAEFVRTLPDDNAKRRAAIEARLKSDPEDFWLNRLYLDSSVYQRSAIRDRYRQRAEAHPGNVEDEYLYGRSLVGSNTAQALRIYADILGKDPDYPWVHYSQLEIFRAEAFRDRTKLHLSFDTLTRVCPAWIEPYRYLNSMDGETAAIHAPRLRALLEASKAPRDLRLYQTLWAVEFRIRPPSERDAEKERIAADLRRLSQFEGEQTVIAAGAKLIGNDALAKEMTAARPPDLMAVEQAWRDAHPYPHKDDPPEKKRAFAEARLEASAKWIAMDPGNILGYNDRFAALAALHAPTEQISAAGDDVVRIARTARQVVGPSFIAGIAETYVEHGILLDRVPALIEEAMKGFDDPEAVIEIDLAPSHQITQMIQMELVRWHVEAITTLSSCYEKLGQLNKARAVLAPIPAYLASKPVPANMPDNSFARSIVSFHALAQFSYWVRLAELDAQEHRAEDALKEYREALLVWDGRRADLLARQQRLWKDLGRPENEWQAWVDSIPRPAWEQKSSAPHPDFAPVNRALPKITLKDLDGNEWPADRLLAKTTIAVVWATWCTPCVKELPYVDQLAVRLKDHPEVQVISFNTDDDPELAKLFVAKNGYKFPVLPAKNFAEDLMPYFSIPRTWIIQHGAIVEESEGFTGDGAQWIDRVAAQVK